MTPAIRLCHDADEDAMRASGDVPAGRLSILLMDDSAFDRKTFDRIARKSQFDLDLRDAVSIAEARAMIAEHVPDMVFLDFRVPDGDGIDFAEELSGIYGHETPPVVIVTGEGDEMAAVRSLRCGAADYLRKEDLSVENFDAAILNGLAARHRPEGQENPELRDLHEELEALRRTTQMNMHLAKSFMLPIAERAWQSLAPLPRDQRAAEATRLKKVTERLTGFLDETLINAETEARARQPELIEMYDVAIAARDASPELACVQIGPRSTFPTLHGNRAQMLMLMTELCAEAVANVPTGTMPDVQVTCALDPAGAPILMVTDNGQSLGARREAMAEQARKSDRADYSASGRSLVISTCQRLAELNGGRFKIRDGKKAGCVAMVRFSVVTTLRH